MASRGRGKRIQAKKNQEEQRAPGGSDQLSETAKTAVVATPTVQEKVYDALDPGQKTDAEFSTTTRGRGLGRKTGALQEQMAPGGAGNAEKTDKDSTEVVEPEKAKQKPQAKAQVSKKTEPSVADIVEKYELKGLLENYTEEQIRILHKKGALAHLVKVKQAATKRMEPMMDVAMAFRRDPQKVEGGWQPLMFDPEVLKSVQREQKRIEKEQERVQATTQN